MWNKDKILIRVDIGDEVKVTTDNGLIWKGLLMAVDEDVVVIQDAMDIQNICIEDILVFTKIVRDTEVKNVIKNILKNSE